MQPRQVTTSAPGACAWAVSSIVPFFEVTTVEGHHFSYRTAWQRRPVVLVLLAAESAESRRYIDDLRLEAGALRAHETEVVVTTDAIVDAPRPAVILVDRWGEIQHVAAGRAGARRLGLPSATALLEWLRYVWSQCPECEGEAR